MSENMPHSEKTLHQRTKSIVRNDRLELLRGFADEKNTYCFFVSLYECAYHIWRDKMPPRVKEAEAKWLNFGGEDGSVSVEDFLDMLVKVANDLDVKITKTYGNRTMIDRFIQNKSAEVESVDANGENLQQDGTSYFSSHCESQSGRERILERVKLRKTEGWKTAVIITLAAQLETDSPNSIESLDLIEVSEGNLILDYPFVLFMLRED